MKTRLVVLLHAFNQSPSDLHDIERLIKEELKVKDDDIFAPELPIGFLSFKDLAQLSEIIAGNIQDRWHMFFSKNYKPYDEILIVGHSMGATLARSVFLYGVGSAIHGETLTTNTPMKWTEESTTRIVQFAAFNRGWEVSYLAQGLCVSSTLAILNWTAYKLRWLLGQHVGLQIYRGSPFINEMRLRWLKLEHQYLKDGNRWPLVVQLLGSTDFLVAPQDAVDLASGKNFVYLDIPFTDHFNITTLYGPSAQKKDVQNRFTLCATSQSNNQEERQDITLVRRRIFIRALTEEGDSLRESSELEASSKPNEDVENVVFVIHGIRDNGHWCQHLARAVLESAAKRGLKDKVKTLTPSYGYFGMGPFLFRRNRLKKVAWFMEHYIEACAQYPNATISYIGHSNGTYLPTCALEVYRSCTFKNLALAGSVVRVHYPWNQSLINRVESVWNMVATKDFIVAGFPRLFDIWPFSYLNDLGGAGHCGFIHRSKNIEHFEYAQGGHSAALDEVFWESLGDFIIDGIVPHSVKSLELKSQDKKAKFVGYFPIIAWAIAFIIVVFFGYAMVGAFYALSFVFGVSSDYFVGAGIVTFIWALITILVKI